MRKYENESDNVLVEMTLLGHNEAFEELVLRHERAVTGTAMKITRNLYSAEDAAQDAFVAVWMKLDSLRDASRFSSFVCQVAKNCAIDLHRRYYCACPDVSLNLLENEDLDRQTEEAQQDEEEYARLRDEVEALGEQTREVIKAHYFEGLGVKEIASKLGCPEGTVKWRLSEGRKLLRKGYGIMEKEYNENETLVRRVMRQVEELKLWTLKNDKTGFEADYRAALSAVEALEESGDKHHALADVLLRGYWWLPGEKNVEVLKRIKESAEKGHNEDVMTAVMPIESDRFAGQEKIDYMMNVQMPYLVKHGFTKTQAYVWFWAGYEYLGIDPEKARECFEKTKSLLHPIDVYYAAAVGSLSFVSKIKIQPCEDYGATGETIRRIDGKYYFWAQPGFGGGGAAIFYYASRLDGMVFDGDMKPGETRTASDKTTTLTFVSDDVTVQTPAGRFERCRRYRIERADRYAKVVETDFAKGVGIVRQKVIDCHEQNPQTLEWLLSSYTVRGGEGYLPFAVGNRWEYLQSGKSKGYVRQTSFYETVGASDDAFSIAHSFYIENAYDLDSFYGNILCARRGYFNQSAQEVYDVLPYIEKAKKLAGAKREKTHAEIAYKVMHRILSTFSGAKELSEEIGRWNFFALAHITRRDGKTILNGNNSTYSFELKDMGSSGTQGYPVLHNFLYDMLADATDGALFDERWTPGAHLEGTVKKYRRTLNVQIDVAQELERVQTPAGVFDNCLKLTYDLKGAVGGLSYRGGVKNYWFAPGVGIVQMKAPYGPEGQYVSHWALTEYRGTGEGFFPCGDGLFRRYEAQNLQNGWHGAVEYTFLEDEDGLTLFRDALGTQDRANYEADHAK